MPGAGRNTKIYKLKPTDGPLNRDDVSTWVFTAKSYARQNGWSQFLTDGDNPTWVPTDEDPNNGLAVPGDATETKKLRDSFKDFLAAIAANFPTGFTDTFVRKSTSFKWIEEKIQKTFNLTTKGESFLDGLNFSFKFDDSFTHSQAWMDVKGSVLFLSVARRKQIHGQDIASEGDHFPSCNELPCIPVPGGVSL